MPDVIVFLNNGLAAAIFIPWMNISGSLLANYWCKRPVRNQNEQEQTEETEKSSHS